MCPCLEATGDIPSIHHGTGLVEVQELGLNWGKQAKIFMLLRGLGRAGTGWVKFWEHQNLCAAGMGECSTSSHFWCPMGRGMWRELRGRMTAGAGVERGHPEGFSPARSPSFPHGLPQLLLAQHFLQEPQQGWRLARLSCYPTSRVPKADISLLMLWLITSPCPMRAQS